MVRCREKVKKINKRIDLLEFQRHLESIHPVSIESRIIEAGAGIDWGIYWKDALVTLLPLHSVKRLGSTRARNIIETFRTIGELESWRIVNGFGSIPGLPKGVARDLEECLVRWLRRYAPDYRILASPDSMPVQQTKQNMDGDLQWLLDPE